MTGQLAVTVLGASACVVMGVLIARAVRKAEANSGVYHLTRPEVWLIAKYQAFRLSRDMRPIKRKESENS